VYDARGNGHIALIYLYVDYYITERFNMNTCKQISTPLEHNVKLSNDYDTKEKRWMVLCINNNVGD